MLENIKIKTVYNCTSFYIYNSFKSSYPSPFPPLLLKSIKRFLWWGEVSYCLLGCLQVVAKVIVLGWLYNACIPNCLFFLYWILSSTPGSESEGGHKKCAVCLQKLNLLPCIPSHGLCLSAAWTDIGRELSLLFS